MGLGNIQTRAKHHVSERELWKVMVTKVADVRDVVKTGVTNPSRAFPVIKALAKSDDWVEREVSATALVEISKKNLTR